MVNLFAQKTRRIMWAPAALSHIRRRPHTGSTIHLRDILPCSINTDLLDHLPHCRPRRERLLVKPRQWANRWVASLNRLLVPQNLPLRRTRLKAHQT
jgi:hypothetical protein